MNLRTAYDFIDLVDYFIVELLYRLQPWIGIAGLLHIFSHPFLDDCVWKLQELGQDSLSLGTFYYSNRWLEKCFFASKYLFSLDEIFYAGLAFLVVYVLVYAIMRLIGIFVHLLNFINPDTRLTNGISGGLSVVVTLISLQLVLTVAATVPIATVQNYLQGSFVANAIIKYTPIMTSVLQQLWVTNVVG